LVHNRFLSNPFHSSNILLFDVSVHPLRASWYKSRETWTCYWSDLYTFTTPASQCDSSCFRTAISEREKWLMYLADSVQSQSLEKSLGSGE
jgi:hypothetical protein